MTRSTLPIANLKSQIRNPQPWAAVFDWDGVVVDSSRAHQESWVRLSHEETNPLPAEHFRRGFGMKHEVISRNPRTPTSGSRPPATRG